MGGVTGTVSIAATLVIESEVEFKLVHMVRKNCIDTCVACAKLGKCFVRCLVDFRCW